MKEINEIKSTNVPKVDPDKMAKVDDSINFKTGILEESEETIEESKAQPSLVNGNEADKMERFDDVYFDVKPNEICTAERDNQVFTFGCQNNVTMKVYVLSETIFRFRYAVEGQFKTDFSYALDPAFKEQNTAIQFIENDSHYLISTPKLDCKIIKMTMQVAMLDKQSNIICEDEEGYVLRRTIMQGISSVAIKKKATISEQYLGLGDKSCSLNMHGQKLENWATDAFAYGEDTDPLYRAIPFYYGLNRGMGYGIFLDNSHRSTFDFNSQKDGVTTFEVNGGEMNYYFIYGPELMSVAQQYMSITGNPELPPIWAMGFHQCRWSYYPDTRVRELAAEFRQRQIPCDAIYLDIDYMDGWRCFTVNEKHFPDLKGLTNDLAKDGFSMVVMIDPGIKKEVGYWVYDDGIKKNVFCRRTDGEIMTGPVWPDDCVFPDFTNPEVRTWWEGLYQGLYGETGIAGFWNDMNEPAVFRVNRKTFPDEVLHAYDGQGATHKKAHNIYGQQMTRATQNGLKKIQPNQRPFVLTRASFCGGQRYAAAWTGDNIATWEQLQLANLQCQRMSLSGFSFIGTDIGGFVDKPTGELMVRWLQLGVFHPLYRIHSMGYNEDGSAAADEIPVDRTEEKDPLDQEPWSFGEDYALLCKAAIELRYQLLPYLYTGFQQSIATGKPLLRSLFFYDQYDAKLRKVEREFMCGDHILVSPVIKEKAKLQSLYLPKGNWYNYWTGERQLGAMTSMVDAPLNQIPFFVKAGAVLPHYPVRQHTKETVKELSLHVYYGAGIEESKLYEDAGDGYDYKNGNYQLLTFQTEGSANSFKITTQKEGTFKPPYSTRKLYFYGIPFLNPTCTIDGKVVPLLVEMKGKELVYVLEYYEDFQELVIV